MRIKARAVFDPTVSEKFGVPKGQGFLILQLDQDYRPKMGEEIVKIKKRQSTKLAEAVERWNAVPPIERGPEPKYQDFLLDLELDLTIHYQKRSLDQNALSWALYEIEANFCNNSSAYQFGYKSKFLPDHVITPQEIHDADVDVYCERRRWKIERKDKMAFSRAMELGEMGRLTNVRDIEGEPQNIAVDVVKSTSFFTTAEMTIWTKRQIDRIIENGLLKSDEARFIGIKQDFQEIIKGRKK